MGYCFPPIVCSDPSELVAPKWKSIWSKTYLEVGGWNTELISLFVMICLLGVQGSPGDVGPEVLGDGVGDVPVGVVQGASDGQLIKMVDDLWYIMLGLGQVCRNYIDRGLPIAGVACSVPHTGL